MTQEVAAQEERWDYCSLQCMNTVLASLPTEHGLYMHVLSSCGSQALEHRFSSCGLQAQLLLSLWDLPGPGIKPLSPTLVGEFPTTRPPGKPNTYYLIPFPFHRMNADIQREQVFEKLRKEVVKPVWVNCIQLSLVSVTLLLSQKQLLIS